MRHILAFLINPETLSWGCQPKKRALPGRPLRYHREKGPSPMIQNFSSGISRISLIRLPMPSWRLMRPMKITAFSSGADSRWPPFRHASTKLRAG